MFNIKQKIVQVKKLLDLNINGKKFGIILVDFQKTNQKSFHLDVEDFLCQLCNLERNLSFECDDLKSFLKSFHSLLVDNFPSGDYQIDDQKKKIKEIEKKFIDFTKLNNKVLEIKSYLDIPGMNNFYSEADNLLIQTYESLNMNIKHNETQLDMLINEKQSKEKEMNELNSKEYSNSSISDNHNFLDLDRNEINQNIKKSIKELKKC